MLSITSFMGTDYDSAVDKQHSFILCVQHKLIEDVVRKVGSGKWILFSE